MPKNIVLDNTVFSTLMSCPRLSNFRFGQNLIGIRGKSPSLEMGTIAHVIVEYYYKGLMAGAYRQNSIDLGMQAGRNFANDKNEVKNTTPEDIELVFTTMEQYFDFYKNDDWSPVAVELVKGEVVYEDDEIRILWKAKMDAIVKSTQMGELPMDHKTMRQRRDTLSLNNQFMGQCVVNHCNRVIINKIGFQTSLKSNEKFTRPVMFYSAERLMEWQSEILPYYAKLMLLYEEADYWPPNFTHCENKYGFCPFKEVCEAPPSLRGDELRSHFVIGEPWDPAND
jgi:hypothetical protein